MHHFFTLFNTANVKLLYSATVHAPADSLLSCFKCVATVFTDDFTEEEEMQSFGYKRFGE